MAAVVAYRVDEATGGATRINFDSKSPGRPANAYLPSREP